MDATVDDAKDQRDLGLEFFGGVLDGEERRLLADAYDLEGLDHEIAVLRVKLRAAIKERPDDYRLMMSGMGTLVRMTAARHRMSPKARKDLADNMAAVLNGLGDLLLPPAS